MLFAPRLNPLAKPNNVFSVLATVDMSSAEAIQEIYNVEEKDMIFYKRATDSGRRHFFMNWLFDVLFVWASSENRNKGEWMNQKPCVSKYGICARITKSHLKSHAQHKSRRQNPTIQPSPAPTTQPVHGSRNSQGSKDTAHTKETKTRKKTNSWLDKRSAFSFFYDRGSILGMFKQRTCGNSVLPDINYIYLSTQFINDHEFFMFIILGHPYWHRNRQVFCQAHHRRGGPKCERQARL